MTFLYQTDGIKAVTSLNNLSTVYILKTRRSDMNVSLYLSESMAESINVNTTVDRNVSLYLSESTAETINVNTMVDMNASLYLSESTAETINVVLTRPTVCAEFVSQRLQPLQSTHSIHAINIKVLLYTLQVQGLELIAVSMQSLHG